MWDSLFTIILSEKATNLTTHKIVIKIATFWPIPTYFLENLQSGEQAKGKYNEEGMQRVIQNE